MKLNPENIELFNNMPVRQAVLKQSIPAIVSQLVTLLYNLTDTYFIGVLSNPVLVAAATAVLPVYLLLTAIGNLPGVGGGSRYANYLGEKDCEGASCVSSAAFWMGVMLSLSFCMAFPIFAKPLLMLCGADNESITPAMDYAYWVIVIGGVPVILNLVLSNLIRAEGMARKASIGITIGGLLNIILDPLLILPQFLNLGITGAGIATAFSNIVSMIFFVILIYIKKNNGTTNISLKPLLKSLKYIPDIAKVGISSSLQYLLTVVAVGAQTCFVSKYGNTPLAALGIIKRLNYLPLYFTIGLSQGILPLLAYNHSAGNIERRKSVFRFGCIISLSFAILCFIIYQIFAKEITGFFINDTETISYASSFLRMMVIAMPFMAISYLAITQFQAMQMVKEALICSIIRKGVLDIPLLILLDSLFPLYGCMWVQPIVDFISFIVAMYFILIASRCK